MNNKKMIEFILSIFVVIFLISLQFNIIIVYKSVSIILIGLLILWIKLTKEILLFEKIGLIILFWWLLKTIIK